jgi:hypothetical protein
MALTQKLDDKLMQKDNISNSNKQIEDTEKPNIILNSNFKCKNIDSLDRETNIQRLKILFEELGINKKCADLKDVYLYKAMNLSGIGIGENDFGEVRAGKYIQIIAISYEIGTDERKKAKNISLGYFGSGASLTVELKNKIIEFILRWRYEKGCQSQDHYKLLINKIIP